LLQQLLQLRQHESDRRTASRGEGAGRAEQARAVLQQTRRCTAAHADREVSLALADRDMAELGAVSEALARVHDADFGECIDCGAAIPFDRLKLEPWARRCVACQGKYEAETSPATPRATI
jgi:DnaK suppressor protein